MSFKGVKKHVGLVHLHLLMCAWNISYYHNWYARAALTQ